MSTPKIESVPFVTVVLSFGGPYNAASPWFIRGTAQGTSMLFAGAKLPAPVNGKITVTLVSKVHLPDQIDYFTANILWEVSPDRGTNWQNLGMTNTVVYVTGAKPTVSYETVIATGCEAAAGLTPGTSEGDLGVFEAVAGWFAGLSVSHIHEGIAVGPPMTYWLTHSAKGNQQTADMFSTTGLLKWSDGRCEAWASFFMNVLQDQGLLSTTPTPAHAAVGGVDFTIASYPAGVPAAPKGASRGFFVPMDGQGHDIPTEQYFVDHEVVVFEPPSGTHGQFFVFDPSYDGGLLNAAVYGQGPDLATAEDSYLGLIITNGVQGSYVNNGNGVGAQFGITPKNFKPSGLKQPSN